MVKKLDADASRAGVRAHALATELFPIARSITGNGVRETLDIIGGLLPGFKCYEIPTGTSCFDWEVPREWNIRDAYIIGPDGEKVVDFKRHNLHVVGYSVPVDKELGLEELQTYLHSLPDQPDAIPYVTSYYKENWGFCLTHRQRQALKPGVYHAVIDSSLDPGCLTYGELFLPGETKEEIFLSTYVCHPSMGNNELSGPTVSAMLAQWLMERSCRSFTYRIVFITETIAALYYQYREASGKMRKYYKKAASRQINLSYDGMGWE